MIPTNNFKSQKRKKEIKKGTTQVTAAVCTCTALTATAPADPPHSWT